MRDLSSRQVPFDSTCRTTRSPNWLVARLVVPLVVKFFLSFVSRQLFFHLFCCTRLNHGPGYWVIIHAIQQGLQPRLLQLSVKAHPDILSLLPPPSADKPVYGFIHLSRCPFLSFTISIYFTLSLSLSLSSGHFSWFHHPDECHDLTYNGNPLHTWSSSYFISAKDDPVPVVLLLRC